MHILGNASVIASALNRGAGSDDGTAASANAQLHFTDFTTVTVDGNVVAGAHATNLGLGTVKANGVIDFGGAGNINLGGVQIDISARNEGSAAGGPGANATALFNEANAAVNLSIGSGGINVQALASSHRGGGAVAGAIAVIIQDDVAVHGGITVKANAFNGSGGEGNAAGLALLGLQANSGNLTVDGAVDVEALASDHGAGNAFAVAQTAILGIAGATGGITLGSLTDKARAVDSGAGTASAVATAIMDGGNHGPIDHIQILGDLAVNATADNHTGFACDNIGAFAHAAVFFSDAHDIEVGGLVSLGARGTNERRGLGECPCQPRLWDCEQHRSRRRPDRCGSPPRRGYGRRSRGQCHGIFRDEQPGGEPLHRRRRCQCPGVRQQRRGPRRIGQCAGRHHPGQSLHRGAGHRGRPCVQRRGREWECPGDCEPFPSRHDGRHSGRGCRGPRRGTG